MLNLLQSSVIDCINKLTILYYMYSSCSLLKIYNYLILFQPCAFDDGVQCACSVFQEVATNFLHEISKALLEQQTRHSVLLLRHFAALVLGWSGYFNRITRYSYVISP